MTSTKHLTVFGTVVSSTNSELLVSQVRFLPGLKIISQIENKESSFLVLRLIMCRYKQVFHKAPFSDRFFFLLYINDIVDDIGANIRLFADDTSLYIIVENPAAAALCLSNDLGKISRWASLWLVTFNPVKNETMLLTRKRNKLYHPPLFMQNHRLLK